MIIYKFTNEGIIWELDINVKFNPSNNYNPNLNPSHKMAPTLTMALASQNSQLKYDPIKFGLIPTEV